MEIELRWANTLTGRKENEIRTNKETNRGKKEEISLLELRQMRSQAQINGQIRAIEGKLINTLDEDEARTINMMISTLKWVLEDG